MSWCQAHGIAVSAYGPLTPLNGKAPRSLMPPALASAYADLAARARAAYSEMKGSRSGSGEASGSSKDSDEDSSTEGGAEAEAEAAVAVAVALRWVLDQGLAAITTTARPARLAAFVAAAAADDDDEGPRFALSPVEIRRIADAAAGVHFRGFWTDWFAPDDTR